VGENGAEGGPHDTAGGCVLKEAAVCREPRRERCFSFAFVP